MKVSIPGNSEAEIWIPSQFKKVHMNGKKVKSTSHVQYAGTSRNIYLVKSGIFDISAIK